MSKNCTFVLLFVSLVGVLLGLSGCIGFFIIGNNKAVVFALLTLGFAFLNMFIHTLHVIGKLEMYNIEIFNQIKDFAFCCGIILLGLLMYNMFVLCYWKLSYKEPMESSLLVVAIWIILAMIFAFMLCKASCRYIGILITNGRPLLQA